jgi:hypothetical protein
MNLKLQSLLIPLLSFHKAVKQQPLTLTRMWSLKRQTPHHKLINKSNLRGILVQDFIFVPTKQHFFYHFYFIFLLWKQPHLICCFLLNYVPNPKSFLFHFSFLYKWNDKVIINSHTCGEVELRTLVMIFCRDLWTFLLHLLKDKCLCLKNIT